MFGSNNGIGGIGSDFMKQFANFGNLRNRCCGEEDKVAEEATTEKDLKAQDKFDKHLEKNAKKLEKFQNKDNPEAAKKDKDQVEISPEAKDEKAKGTGFKSPIEEFRAKLNQMLLGSLDLDGNQGLPGIPGSEVTQAREAEEANPQYVQAQAISARFEMSYQSMMAVANEDGTFSTREVSFSLSASFDFMSIASGNTPGSFNPFGSQGVAGEGAVDPMQALQDFFSPEKTADRILDFSLGFFPNSRMAAEGGNTEDSRQKFVDVIGAAIQKGFDEAMAMLGQLPEQTQNEVDETHERVFTGLDDFVTEGYDEEDENRWNNSMQYYESMFELNYSSTEVYYSADEVQSMFGNNQNALNSFAQQLGQNGYDAPGDEVQKALDVTA